VGIGGIQKSEKGVAAQKGLLFIIGVRALFQKSENKLISKPYR
jgi:hypothetical protein